MAQIRKVVKLSMRTAKIMRIEHLIRIIAPHTVLEIRECRLVSVYGRLVRRIRFPDETTRRVPSSIKRVGFRLAVYLEFPTRSRARICFRIRNEVLISVIGVGITRPAFDFVDAFFKELRKRDDALLRLALNTPRGDIVFGDRKKRNELASVGGFHRRTCKDIEEFLLVAQREKLIGVKFEFLGETLGYLLVGL